MTSSDHREPPLARLVGRRPNQGAADAAKVVMADVQQLLRAEIDLAKTEVAEGVKSKALGAGFFIVAAVIGWLAVHVFLVFLGFVFALFMPAWVAVGLVLLLLLIAIGLLGYFGYRKLQAKASLETAKATFEEAKGAAQAAVDRAKGNAKQGVEEAKGTLADTATDVKGRVKEAQQARSTRPLGLAPKIPARPAGRGAATAEPARPAVRPGDARPSSSPTAASPTAASPATSSPATSPTPQTGVTES